MFNISFDDLCWHGRFINNDSVRYFNYSSSGFSFVLCGTKAQAVFLSDEQNDLHKAVLGIYITYSTEFSWSLLPENPTKKISLEKTKNEITLFESEEEQIVCIHVIKLSEAAFGFAGLQSLLVQGSVLPLKKNYTKKISFIGDSITCGYGIDGTWGKEVFSTQTERADKSFAFCTARKLGADFECCSWSGIGLISIYVDPATAKLPDTDILMPSLWPYTDKSLSLKLNLEPELFDSSKFSPDIIVINLGTNDASWVQKYEDRRVSFVSAYFQFLEMVYRQNPNACFCTCLGVMGQDLCSSVKDAVEKFSTIHPSAKIITVDLPLQKEQDGIGVDWHPSAKTHQKTADFLSEKLKVFFK